MKVLLLMVAVFSSLSAYAANIEPGRFGGLDSKGRNCVLDVFVSRTGIVLFNVTTTQGQNYFYIPDQSSVQASLHEGKALQAVERYQDKLKENLSMTLYVYTGQMGEPTGLKVVREVPIFGEPIQSQIIARCTSLRKL